MRLLAWGGAFQGKALVDEGDSIAMTGEAVCGQLCSTKNHNGLSMRGCHENRERSQTPAARASRWGVESRTRGPNTRCSGFSIFFRMRE